jgi:predicted transcriptional regulator of viral defense system
MYASKTLGSRTSRLFSGVHDTGITVFNLEAASALMGVTHRQAASLLHAAAKRGLVTPVKRGLYNLVPFELGPATFHLEDRYVLVRESLGDISYFLSYASALDIHQLATQPNFEVYVTSPVRRKNMNLGGSTTHMVWVPPSRFFGQQSLKVGNVTHRVSDIERTLVDAVSIPRYCGGFIEVAKAYFMAKSKVDSAKLIAYAYDYKKWSVIRRAGYLLEFFGMASQSILENFARGLPPGYSKLDPELPKEGLSSAKWGLTLNVSRDELTNAVSH